MCVVYGCRFFHLSPEIQLCFERTSKTNCFLSQVEIKLLWRLWKWLYKAEGDIYLWTIATHQVLQSAVGCRMISACLLDVKVPDQDSISNQVLQPQGEFCVFRKYLQWFGFPVLGVPEWFPRWHSLHCLLHNSPTRGSYSSRLILFYVEIHSYVFKIGKSFDHRWRINDICLTIKRVMKPQTI